MDLLEEMKQHTEKLKKMREHEDPMLSFATPEFKEAQRVFQENYKVRERRRRGVHARAQRTRRKGLTTFNSLTFCRKTFGDRLNTVW